MSSIDEPPRQERLSSVTKLSLLAFVQGWFPILTLAISGIWALYVYTDNAGKERASQADQREAAVAAKKQENQAPFLAAKRAALLGLIDVAGNALSLRPGGDKSSRIDALQEALKGDGLDLLGTSDEPEIQDAIGKLVFDLEELAHREQPTLADARAAEQPKDIVAVHDSARALALAIRNSIRRSWGDF